MKFSSKIYAKVLLEMISEKKDKNEKKIIDNFFKILEKNRDLKKAKEVISLIEKMYFKKIGKRKVELETARKIDYKNLGGNFLKESDIIEEKINPDLVAGIKIIINDEKQLDFSLKNKLDSIF